MFPVVHSHDLVNPTSSNDFRQSGEEGTFKYTALINRSPSVYTNEEEASVDENHLNSEKSSKMVKSDSDQKLPDSTRDSYIYVNKNGFPVQSKVLSPNIVINDSKHAIGFNNEQNPLMCTNLLLEMYKNNKDNLTSNAKNLENHLNPNSDQLSVNRSVPNHDCNSSMSSVNISSNNSLVRRDSNGNIQINTNLTIQEPTVDINYDHIKYVNIFSIMCCWCFPITGILSIFYSRLTKRYYEMRDMEKAKKYLGKSEWMLLLTFFFGFTIIAIVFALMEAFLFKTNTLRGDGTSLLAAFHRRSPH